MGSSKKHKKHKSERREKYEEYRNKMDSSQLQRGLKLILKVGPNNTPEYTSNSTSTGENVPLNPAFSGPPTAAEAMCSSPIMLEDLDEPRIEKHKKSKKKKKKDRERKHKHHKEKKRHRSERYIDNNDNGHTFKECEGDEENLDSIISQDCESVTGITDAGCSQKLNSINARTSNVDGESSQDVFSFVDDNSALPENILFFEDMTCENVLPCRQDSKSEKLQKSASLFLESPASSSHQSSFDLISAQSSRTMCVSPTKRIPELIVLSSSPSLADSTPEASSNAELITKSLEAPKTPSSSSESGRDHRPCILKMKPQNFALNKLLQHLLRVLEKRDHNHFFAWPVTDDYAPGYSHIITNPMDFSTMRQKIDNDEYSTLIEFTNDFQLMCENAIKYNHVDTIYYKAAKRLLQIGLRQLSPENLMRSLKPLSCYMRQLTVKELGFELIQNANGESNINVDYEYQTIADSADEDTSTEIDEALTQTSNEDKKRRIIRSENQPKSRFEPYVDDMTPDEVLAQVQSAAKQAQNRLAVKNRTRSMGFLRQNKNGTTSLNFLIKQKDQPSEKIVNLGNLISELEKSTSQLNFYYEDKRNDTKSLKPVHYTPFNCCAPTFDSRFSTLNKEETQLIMQTYGDAVSAEYAESILQFTKDSSYATMMANSLLDVLTNGEHTKCMKNLYDLQVQNYEQKEALKCFNNLGPIIDTTASSETRAQIGQEYEKYKSVRLDFNYLRSLSNLGIDINFLDEVEKEMKNFELARRLQEHLSNNLNLIDKLKNTQNERWPLSLCQNGSVMMGQVSFEESPQKVQYLTDASKKAVGSTISSQSLHKSTDASFEGISIPTHPQQQQFSLVHTYATSPGAPNAISNLNFPPSSSTSSNTTFNASEPITEINVVNASLSMEVDEDVPTTTDGDLENELREFLESDPALHAVSSSNSDDNNLVAQLLMN